MARKKEMCSSENHEPGAGIVLMKLEELHSFEGHPFKVERNQELFELRCSIEKEGVLVPLLVRKNPHGDGYEIIAGHRRKEAALWAGLTEVPVIIRELDDDQSVIAMVDSNLQREKILPSEKAFAYKMRLEAMKHQGRAEADTSDPLEPKCKTELVNVSELEAELQKLGKVKIQKKGGAEGKRSNEQLASMVGESVTQIKRYIRLTHLIPKILDMFDKEILAIRSAVEISFLSEEEQYELHAVMELEQSIPNISQANRLKRMSQQKCLDMDKIYEILQEIKPNQKEQIKLPLERIGKYFPTAYTPKQQVDLIEKLLKNWAKQNVNKNGNMKRTVSTMEKLTYTNVNGYLIPNITYKSGNQMEQLGKYGFLRRDYLKNHRNSTYQVMLLQDTIGEHLLEVDKAAREREEVILKQLEEKEPLPDKEKNQMAWVRAANQHKAIAEEIILKELIYV